MVRHDYGVIHMSTAERSTVVILLIVLLLGNPIVDTVWVPDKAERKENLKNGSGGIVVGG